MSMDWVRADMNPDDPQSQGYIRPSWQDAAERWQNACAAESERAEAAEEKLAQIQSLNEEAHRDGWSALGLYSGIKALLGDLA